MPAYKIHGQAWFEGGRIMEATDTLINGAPPSNVLDLRGNVLQGMGAQFTVVADLMDNLEAGFGFGVLKVNHALGKGSNSLLAISLFQNFLTQSRLTYYLGEKADPSLSFTLGSFPYKYNSDVKNLGLYLLRGPVYPGILMGGFNDFAVDSTKATMLGFKVHHKAGIFSHDLILNSEREIPPTLDWSLAYVAKLKAGPLEIGAGVNFYRLIAYDDSLETPGHLSDASLGFKKDKYIEVDTLNKDTVFFTHQGTKLMGMFSLDLQQLFGMEFSNPDDMKVYGEVGVIGIQDYGKAYNDISKRIPVMVGFNLPTGGWLNHLAFEVEHYGALYRNDLARIGNNNTVAPWTIIKHPIASPKPVSYEDYGIDPVTGNWVNNNTGDTVAVKGTALDKANQTKDNIKWSLFAEKVISNHLSIMAQVANDHYRPKPVATGLIKSEGGTQEAFASPKDWYFMIRMGYFF
ncbi:MAG: hypothetical protein M3Y08_08785 [Fibrobacterota bacterium]|nr:hypothetical protein [Fibrobacterota bacterium]